MNLNSYRYFAYGMNTATQTMTGYEEHGCLATFLAPAALRGWRLEMRGFADVQRVEDPDSVVHGVLWEVSGEMLSLLDSRESYPRFYDRVSVTVDTPWEEVEDVLVYFMRTPGQIQRASNGYVDLCLRGYAEHDVPTAELEAAVARAKSEEASTTW